tara:strand:- start:1056 stop:1187 length:132 start_codon:yes stop_codon:yes gene_type:complete
MKKGRDVPDFEVQKALDEFLGQFYGVVEEIVESKKEKSSDKED